MWYIFQSLIISIILIGLLHTGIQYIQSTYTVEKYKDVLTIQSEKYEKMLREVIVRKKEETSLAGSEDQGSPIA